jgi:predicted phosphohydrolase
MPRIVAVADTHLYESDEYVVPEGDIFIHAGDMCRGGRMGELRLAATWVKSLPHKQKIVIAGNHDWPFVHANEEAQELFDGVTYLQDSQTIIDGLRIYGAPWQPRFFDWAFNLPRGKDIAAMWAKIPTGLDVLITHGPPFKCGDLTADGDPVGCQDLLLRVQRAVPKLHLFGHIHTDGGAWQRGPTTFANVTTAECRRAPTVIDFYGDTVRVVSAPPRR